MSDPFFLAMNALLDPTYDVLDARQTERADPLDEWDQMDREREAACMLALSNCLAAGADPDDLNELARQLNRAEAWAIYQKQERLL